MLQKHIQEYVNKVIGVTIHFKEWKFVSSLPRFLSGQYDFMVGEFLNQQILFLLQHESIKNTPAAIQKHINMVNEKWTGPVVYAAHSMPSFDRRSLIEHRTQFIIPDTSLYMPEFGVVIKEYFRQRRTNGKVLSPSAQLVLLHALNRNEYNPQTPSLLANKLGYSAMTLTRALDELEILQLAEVKNQGRERTLAFEMKGKQLWQKALSFLRSPVKKSIWMKSIPSHYASNKAGLTALAMSTRLAEPPFTVYAIAESEWKKHESDIPVNLETLHHPEPGAVCIELWRYEPGVLGKNGLVDPLSLYLSLKDDKDERVEGELESMLEAFFAERT